VALDLSFENKYAPSQNAGAVVAHEFLRCVYQYFSAEGLVEISFCLEGG